jgi:cytoskeletal protein CcmA (bactofilin family)
MTTMPTETTTLGSTISVRGELRASEDLTIHGRIDGPIHCEGGAVTVGASADLLGDIIARDVTIFGRASGQIVATDVVDIRDEAVVSGTIVSKRLILNAGGHFTGRVEPQHLEAALRVAKYHRGRRDTSA